MLTMRSKKTIIAITLATALTIFFYSTRKSQNIVDFDKSLEQREFLHKVFKENSFLLLFNPNDFDLDFMLENGISHNRPMPQHKMKLYRDDNGKYVGFTAYYHPYLYQHNHALLLFLVVDQEARGKGYGRKLMSYALNDLKKEGCTSVELAVREKNYTAQKLYKSFGFYPYSQDEDCIRMRRLLI